MKKKPAFSALASLLLLCTLFLPGMARAAAPIDFRELVKSAMPAVVNISTERTEQMRSFGGSPFEMFRGHPDMDRFFDPFDNFFNSQPRSRKTSSLGSGFIISADGYIVTNNHVVEGADVVRVNVGGKSDKDDLLTAEVIGTDPESDLALLKVQAENLPFLVFGDSDVLEVGEWVVAIGSPLGLDHTVTAGIVSAKGRNIQSGSYDDFLQTDASINRGNSGGPLLNMKGEVVGINTAIAQRAQGIGFAIPSSMAQQIIDSLREHKKFTRGWLGVTIQNVDSTTAKALGMQKSSGALVNSVLDGHPAARAGIKEGDVIIAIDNKQIENTDQLLRTVALLKPGTEVKILVWRDGKEQPLTLTVAERDGDGQNGKGDGKDGASGDDLLGLKVRAITQEDIRRYGLHSNAGLMVTGVAPESAAAKAGVLPGDILLAVNRQAVNTQQELSDKIRAEGISKGAVLLQISRRGQVFYRPVEVK